jgi:integrase
MAIVERKISTGEVHFQVKVKDRAGKWFETKTFKQLDAALRYEADLVESKRKGALVLCEDAFETSMDDYWAVWSEENRTEISEGWKLSQNQMYRDYVSPVLGEAMVGEIGAPEIGKVLKRVKDLGRSPRMRLHIYTLLHQMFRDLVEYYEMLTQNPVKEKFHRPEINEFQADFLNPEQAMALLNYSKEHWMGPGIWLQTLAGLRTEAMIGLKPDSILWDLNQLLIRRAWKRKVKKLEDYPKGKKAEYVPLVPALKDYLKQVCLKRDPDDFVVQSPNGGMMPYQTYYKALGRVCRAAQVPVVSPHELRHSCTELWVQIGATQEDLRRLLNHKSVETTKHYVHRTDGRLSALALRFKGFEVIDGGVSRGSFPYGKQESVLPVEKVAVN